MVPWASVSAAPGGRGSACQVRRSFRSPPNSTSFSRSWQRAPRAWPFAPSSTRIAMRRWPRKSAMPSCGRSTSSAWTGSSMRRHGIARHLHDPAIGHAHGEEIRRGAAALQRPHRRSGRRVGPYLESGRPACLRGIRRPHAAIPGVSPRAGAARPGDRASGRARVGRQRRQPHRSQGAQQGSRAPREHVRRALEADLRRAGAGHRNQRLDPERAGDHRGGAGRGRRADHLARHRPAAERDNAPISSRRLANGMETLAMPRATASVTRVRSPSKRRSTRSAT